MSSSDPSKPLLMQHFLKDLMIMLSGMAFYGADIHHTTSEGAAGLIFPVAVISQAGSTIQVRYCYLTLSLKGFLMDTSIGCITDVIPPGMTTSCFHLVELVLHGISEMLFECIKDKH